MYLNHITEAIGNTPLVKLNKVTEGIKGTILAKVEYFNPGHSVKDRIALRMIEDAEAAGLLQIGGTIIEATIGNTGTGLALAASAKGYHTIFVMSDKQSLEKRQILQTFGAQAVICPANVRPDDARSYYSVARRIHQEIPNSFFPNQYDNRSNTIAHYETTGPEIWHQTDGHITHLAVGVGTGGTISGTSKYLKEKNSHVFTLGIEPYGSIFQKVKETNKFDPTESYSYMTEGIGQGILPQNVDFAFIDQFIKVADRNGALMVRNLANKEGLFVGRSSGSAVFGALEYARTYLGKEDTMVIILPDHGSRYLSKIYNDNWMHVQGWLQ